MDLKSKTEDELRDLNREISTILEDRKKEPTKTVYVVRCAGNETFHKLYSDAKADLINELDFVVEDNDNKITIESREIPESEYQLRPNTWYSC